MTQIKKFRALHTINLIQFTCGGIGEEEAIVFVHQTKPGDIEVVSPVIVDLSHDRKRVPLSIGRERDFSPHTKMMKKGDEI